VFLKKAIALSKVVVFRPQKATLASRFAKHIEKENRVEKLPCEAVFIVK